MKEAVKRLLRKSPDLYEVLAFTYDKMMKPRRFNVNQDRRIITEYMRTTTVKKLQIGSGFNSRPGWLNSDLYPRGKEIYLDARKPFRFEDGVFDYIFSEHLIEHISYPEGLKMLSECYRVLKPNGKIRIATPDLLFLINLYRQDKSELQKGYIKWSTDTFIPSASFYADTFVINNMVRSFGHRFIYDEKVLRCAMERAGFVNVTTCLINESEDRELRGLENVDRAPQGYIELETLILEGTKPSRVSHE